MCLSIVLRAFTASKWVRALSLGLAAIIICVHVLFILLIHRLILVIGAEAFQGQVPAEYEQAATRIASLVTSVGTLALFALVALCQQILKWGKCPAQSEKHASTPVQR
jgi:hypothetical protein